MIRSVLLADAQHPYHSFHVKIVLSIAVIVSRLSAPPAVLIVMIHAAIVVVVVVVIAEIGAITVITDGRKLIF